MINIIPPFLKASSRLFLSIVLLTFIGVFTLSTTVNARGRQPSIFLQDKDFLIINNWQIISKEQNISDKISLPILAPATWDKVTYRNVFHLPDTIQSKNIKLWISKIHGIASLKINNIAIRHRLNYPTNFTIQVPQNLLNTNGENTLEIDINRPSSPEEGIPELVRLFSNQKNLGICGDVFLTWDKNAFFTELNHKYTSNNLSYHYELMITDPELISKAPFPKIRCEEEISSPDGQIIHKRFEYLDLTTNPKQFSRTIPIKNPLLWSADTSLFYTIRLRAMSDMGLISSYEQKIGLREFTIKDGEFYINKQRTKIKGCTYRLSYPIYGEGNIKNHSNDFYTQVRHDLVDIKRIGFNAVRFPQDAAHPHCFHLADSLGLYLFIENGLWRVPEPYFKNDQLLQASKTIADEAISDYGHHPSFIAFGLGTEIPIHLPPVEKFILILKRYIQQKSPVSLYTIPLNYQYIKAKSITDFYIFNKYDTSLLSDYKTVSKHFESIRHTNVKPLWGNVGFSLSDGNEIEDTAISENIQASKLKTFFQFLGENSDHNGFFLESYRDWQSDVPARIAIETDDDRYIYPYGLLDWDGHKRAIYYSMSDLLNNPVELSQIEPLEIEKTNFFSVSVFILSIFFFYIFRRDYRFRENLKRSLSHPFGFFVDLRDRRIISILDSTIVGLYTNFLVTAIIASYLFFMRDNLYFAEYLSSVLMPVDLKLLYVSIINSPLKITLLIWIFFYFLQLTVVILLKILNLLAVEKIRFRQYLAICNWAGAPLLFLLPASLLSYHLMYYDWYHWLAVLILGGFFFWYNFRLGNSLRVLLTMRVFKTFSLLIIAYGGTYILFRVIFETNFGLMTYFNLLNDANLLF